MGGPWANREMPMGRPGDTHQTPTRGTVDAHYMPNTCPWDAREMPMGCPWDGPGMPLGPCYKTMGYPCNDLLVAMRDQHVLTTDYPCNTHGMYYGHPTGSSSSYIYMYICSTH